MTFSISHKTPHQNNADLSKTDQQIWSEFRDGSERAFSDIYQNHVEALYDYGMKISNSSELVKDSIHDVFMDLWKSRENLQVTHSIRFYLVQSIKRKVFLHTKKERKYSLKEDLSFDDEAVLNFKHDDSDFEDNKIIKVTDALKSLTKRQKEAIYLRYYNNLNNQEIAQVMNISLHAVYNLISKAIQNLKSIIKYIQLIVITLLLG